MIRKFQVVVNLICLFNKGVELRKMKVKASKLLGGFWCNDIQISNVAYGTKSRQ